MLKIADGRPGDFRNEEKVSLEYAIAFAKARLHELDGNSNLRKKVIEALYPPKYRW